MVSAVYRGFLSGEELGRLLNDEEICRICQIRYSKLKQVIINELYDIERNIFLRGIRYEDHDTNWKIIDSTADSSVYWIFEFDLLPADDPRVVRTIQNLEEKLWVPGKRGMARYETDPYHRKTDLVTGNPWLICTLWLAKWYVAKAKENRDLEKALELINWVADCSLETGIMPEQIHPFTEESLSVAPLTWSHAEFVDTITRYQEKKAQLKV